MMTVVVLLLVAAFVATVAAGMGKCPLWIAVLFLCVIELIRSLPLGA